MRILESDLVSVSTTWDHNIVVIRLLAIANFFNLGFMRISEPIWLVWLWLGSL